MKHTITIEVGNNLVKDCQRAFTISKSGKTGSYDSAQWETKDPGTFSVEFTHGTPFTQSSGNVIKGKPWTPIIAPARASAGIAYKYKVTSLGKSGPPIDDPYVVIED
jgi:hypothetical protein